VNIEAEVTNRMFKILAALTMITAACQKHRHIDSGELHYYSVRKLTLLCVSKIMKNICTC